MSRPRERPFDEWIDTPNPGRIYDYLLGGSHNFAVDREVAERMIAIFPDVPLWMRANRAFLRRVITFLVERGIDQFLDIGSGMPTVGNVHTIAQQINIGTRVVYVDHDPLVARQSEALVRDNPRVVVLEHDARDVEAILEHAEVRTLLDFRRPIAVILIGVLHFVIDDREAEHVVQTLRDAVPAGSYVAISHGTTEQAPVDALRQFVQLYEQSTTPGKARERWQIARFLEGLELVEPGLVFVPQWRPEGADDLFVAEPHRACNFGGVAYKR